MRILHLGNYANVPAILKKYQKRLGHEVVVVDSSLYNRRDTTNYWEYDPDIIDYPHNSITYNSFTWAEYHMGEFDLFHNHGLVGEVYAHRARNMAGKRPMMLHLHGYESKIVSQDDVDLYNKVIVATPDLWKEWNTYLPNPIDLEMWNKKEHTGNKALWFKQWDIGQWKNSEKRIIYIAKKLGLDLTIVERWKNFIPYMSMPEFYHNYDILIEWKPGSDYGPNTLNEPALGLSALECLAEGLKVYFVPEKRYITEFPMEHEASRVVNKLEEIYNGKK